MIFLKESLAVVSILGCRFIGLSLLTYFSSSAGLLLREIKDFWPVALLLATLLYPANVDYTEDLLNRRFELEKRKELFDVAYNEIVKLGKPITR